MRSQPLPGEASRRRAEEQFKTTKKVNSETKANTTSRQAEADKTARLRALRLAKEAPTRILQSAPRRQRRPVNLSRAGAFQDLRLQIRQNPSKGPTHRVRFSVLAKIRPKRKAPLADALVPDDDPTRGQNQLNIT